MLNSDCRFVGVRFRGTGAVKWSMAGTKNGLFVPRGLKQRGPVLLVEGPTDCAAALDYGFDSIGRPNDSARRREIVQAVQKVGWPLAVIVADRGKAGFRGAFRLQSEARSGVRTMIIYSRVAKDLRSYYNRGMPSQALVDVIQTRTQNKYWSIL